jgi:hypothetical protein
MLFIACLCRLGKEIGFTDDALKSFAKRKEIFTIAPCHPSLKQRIRNDQWEVPSMISSIYEEVEQGIYFIFRILISLSKLFCIDRYLFIYSLGRYQLLSDGNIEIILDNCSDYWDGQGLHVMSEVVRNSVLKGFIP